MKRMHYLFKILFVIQITIVCLPVSSQEFKPEDYRKDLSVKISIIDEKRIEKGVKLLNEAYSNELQAIDLIESLPEDEKIKANHPNYKKALKKLVQTSEIYREGHMIIYTVFQENCVQFKEEMQKMKHYAAGINKAKLYERKSSKAYERALSIRDLLLEIEKPDLIQYKMAEAVELERMSIQHRGRALQIYQDFPVEYNYNWENDLTPEEVEAAFKDPAISRPPDDLFVQKPVEETPDEPEKVYEGPIVFRVQIVAHTIKMDESYIRENVYMGKLPIKEIYDNKWYKYSIGEFDNFNDANALLKKSRVSKAFVVAYQDGKKLTIKSALAKIKANQ